MPDDTLDGREAQTQCALETVDPVVHLGYAQSRVDQGVEIDNLAVRSLAHPHVVYVAHAAELFGSGRKLVLDRLDALVRGVTAEQPARLQRLDVGLDLHFESELVAHRLLEPVGNLVGAAESKIAVNLEIERDRQSARDGVDGHVMDGKRAVVRDHHDALEHGLIIERARLAVHSRLGGWELVAYRGYDPILDRSDTIERQGPAHRDIEIHE